MTWGETNSNFLFADIRSYGAHLVSQLHNGARQPGRQRLLHAAVIRQHVGQARQRHGAWPVQHSAALNDVLQDMLA